MYPSSIHHNSHNFSESDQVSPAFDGFDIPQLYEQDEPAELMTLDIIEGRLGDFADKAETVAHMAKVLMSSRETNCIL